MKRAGKVAGSEARSQLPRFANRGLIEAGRPRHPRRDGAALPRFANRGLIEAGRRRLRASARPQLPRFANRGLIEALGGYGTAGTAGTNFPDSRIGASLKLEIEHCEPWLPVELPRFANRGLIEASMASRYASASSGLPRFANRGLIEAGCRGSWRSLASMTSPIRESGPH